MSKSGVGCLNFIFGPCARKRNKNRESVSVENKQDREIKEISTQTQDKIMKTSGPLRYFSSFSNSPGPANKIQPEKYRMPLERLVIRNNDANKISKMFSSDDIEPIQNVENNEKLISSGSFFRYFSPNSEKKIIDPFKWDNTNHRPKLTPITPYNFNKRGFKPSSRPVKPLEKMQSESYLGSEISEHLNKI